MNRKARFVCPGPVLGLRWSFRLAGIPEERAGPPTGLQKPEKGLRDAYGPSGGLRRASCASKIVRWAGHETVIILREVRPCRTDRRMPLRGQAQMFAPRFRLATLDRGLCNCELLPMDWTLDSRLFTVSRMFARLSPLEYALTQKRACKSFAIRTCKSLDLKSLGMTLLQKMPGGTPLLASLPPCLSLTSNTEVKNVQTTPPRQSLPAHFRRRLPLCPERTEGCPLPPDDRRPSFALLPTSAATVPARDNYKILPPRPAVGSAEEFRFVWTRSADKI